MYRKHNYATDYCSFCLSFNTALSSTAALAQQPLPGGFLCSPVWQTTDFKLYELRSKCSDQIAEALGS